jgi:P-type conjugative transfer protein TrbJ
MTEFRSHVFMALAAALFSSQAVLAGSVAGTGGSTEVTQIANNVQLANQYAQQVESYVRQGLQLEAQMKNLIQNPASLLGKDVGGIINGVGRLYNAGNSIGGNMAAIDRNFANTFKSPTARTLANSFTHWHSTNTDTLEAAMKSAGMAFDSQQSEAENLQRLFEKSQQSQGNLQVLQTANEINSMNVQQLQKLGNLIASQNLAASTYMATQTAKDERSNLDTDAFKRAMLEKKDVVTPEATRTEYKKWNLYK